MGVIIRLLRGEDRFDYECDWFELHDAALQILPLQDEMPMATASSISPSGHAARRQARHRRAVDRLDLAPRASRPCRRSGRSPRRPRRKHGQIVDRRNWRVLMSWHLAETREQAREEAVLGLQRWHNEYNVRVLGRPGAERVDDPWELLDQVAATGGERRRRGGHRHARRPDRRDPQPAGDHRRLRRRARLRPRLGQPRGDAALVGALSPAT